MWCHCHSQELLATSLCDNQFTWEDETEAKRENLIGFPQSAILPLPPLGFLIGLELVKSHTPFALSTPFAFVSAYSCK